MRLYGIVNPGAPDTELEAALTTMRRDSSGSRHTTRHQRHLGPGVALEVATATSLPHVGIETFSHDDGTVVLAFVGHAFDPSHPSRAIPETLRETFITGGSEALGSLEGHYAVVVWEVEGQRLHLATDRLGMRPLTIAPQGQGIAFASSPLALAKLPGTDRSPDELAWLEFFTFSTMLGDSTFWRGIRRLPQGVVARWSESTGLTEHQHYNLLGLRTDPQLDRDDYLAENHRLFARSMKLHLEAVPETCLTLSAGFDSKRIAVELHRLGAKPPTFTLIEREQPYEHRIAQSLAESLEFPASLMEPELTDADCLDADLLTDYEATDEAWWVPVLRSIPTDRANINGIGGDVLVNGLFLNDDRLSLVEDPPALARSLAQPAFLDFLDKSFRNDLWPKLLAHVTEQLEEIEDPRNRVTLWFFRNRTRRRIARCSYGILDVMTDTLSPYHERDLVEQSLRLDPRHKVNCHPAGEILARFAEEYEHLPTSHTPGIADDPRFSEAAGPTPTTDKLLDWGYRNTADARIGPGSSAYLGRVRSYGLARHLPWTRKWITPKARWLLLPLLARARWEADHT